MKMKLPPERPARRGVHCALPMRMHMAGCGAGCLHDPANPSGQRCIRREFAARGYTSVARHAVTTTVHTWLIDGQNIRIVVCEPNASGTIPLVIYVPGLGEPSDAGERWRNAWQPPGMRWCPSSRSPRMPARGNPTWPVRADFKTLGRQRLRRRGHEPTGSDAR